MVSLERRRSRGGFTIAELIIAMMLLGTATAVMLPLLVAVSAQRRAAELRQLALFEAENLLDRMLARPWWDITEERLSQVVDQTESNLPGISRRVTVVDRPADQAREITVELRWRDRSGQLGAPLRITGWKFAAEKTP